MGTIDNFINVTVSAQASAVAVESFAIPMILGPTDAGWGDDYTRAYTDPAGLLADGFTTESPEYVAAQAMYAGSVTPTQFYVARRTSGTVATDLANAYGQSDAAYGLVLAGLPDADILPTAEYIEGHKKLFLASSADPAIAQTGTEDLLSQLKAAGYQRTGLAFTPANPDNTLEAAWMGSQLPATPGSNNWAWKQLPGIKADSLTANQMGVLVGVPVAGVMGKNGNVYQTLGGGNVTFPGIAAGGQYFDITVGVDWLQANLQADILSVLINNSKVPYTDEGVSLFLNAVNQRLQIAGANGLLATDDPAYPLTATAPRVGAMTANDRALRKAPPISFTVRLKGAFNTVTIKGTVLA